MYKVIHIPELELDRCSHVIEPDNPRMLMDDLQTPLHFALVVVGHFEDE